jgi:uncharacterized protein YdbL (DUF1318 family)
MPPAIAPSCHRIEQMYYIHFTMAMAVLALVFWGLSAISDSGVVTALSSACSAGTVVGGTAMGLLFLVARSREREASKQQS